MSYLTVVNQRLQFPVPGMAHPKSTKSKPQQDLTLGSLIYTGLWNLTKRDAAEALGISISRIVKQPNCLWNCVCIVFVDDSGKKRSRFFSYRIFACWQKAVERIIKKCLDLYELEPVATIIYRDLSKYKYKRPEVRNAIWDALLNRQKFLSSVGAIPA